MENDYFKKHLEDKLYFHFKSVLYHLLELQKTSQQLNELFPQKEQQLSNNELLPTLSYSQQKLLQKITDRTTG